MTERRMIIRSFMTDLTTDGDGRTIVGRCVPYGEIAEVDDGQGPYREMFQRGAFRRAVTAPNKVILDFEHQRDPLSVLGHGVEFVERDDGLHGVFRALNGPVGDQGLEMVRAGLLSGLSVCAVPMGPGRRQGNVTVRTSCHLPRVALCRTPAYAGAVVEALRAVSMPAEPSELTELRPPRNSELDSRLAALGVVSSRD